ncbi:MAG TPA: SDR family oxidoreductase [Ignavibacteria bacterium]|nr:SDR family oxidoreductase [Ignavibacteria bacterium]
MIVSLKNKNAIVCGSSQGIGKSIAMQFAESGANVTLIARNESILKEVIKELKNKNQNHQYIVADFDNSEKLGEIITEFTNNNPPIHILVNNTGGPNPGLAIEANIEDYFCAFNRHLICNQILAKAVTSGMKEEKYGRIINIISTSVKQPIQGLGVSNTIRGAVANWSKTLSFELAPFGITVNNVLPGATSTQRLQNIISNKSKKLSKDETEITNELMREIPVGRFGMPEELAFAVTFLASENASYINGINLPIDGGRTLSL